MLKRFIIKLIYYNKMSRLTGRQFHWSHEELSHIHRVSISFNPSWKKHIIKCSSTKEQLVLIWFISNEPKCWQISKSICGLNAVAPLQNLQTKSFPENFTCKNFHTKFEHNLTKIYKWRHAAGYIPSSISLDSNHLSPHRPYRGVILTSSSSFFLSLL